MKREGSSLILWVLAGLATILTVGVLVATVGSVVPALTQGPVVAGVDIKELDTACKMSSGRDRMACSAIDRMEAALEDGNCMAAKVQARSALEGSSSASLLANKLADYARSRLETCQSEQTE